MAELVSETGNFATVTGGKIRKTKVDGQAVGENTPKAISREVENPQTKVVTLKWELVAPGWAGKIENVYFKEDKNFGDQWVVTMTDGTERINLTFKHKSKYFVTFMCRLMSVDLTEMVEFRPYQFKGEDSKDVTGVTLKQLKENKWENVDSYYHEGVGKEAKAINGYPVFSDEYSKDNWDVHMINVRKFLKSQFDSKLKAKFENTEVPKPQAEEDDLPF